MLWLDRRERAERLPAAWLTLTGKAPRNRAERSALRHDVTRAVLALQLGTGAAGLKLVNEPSGRLIVEPDAPGGLNVSHATRGGLVLTALGTSAIGADIELVGTGPLPLEALHPVERGWLASLPEADRPVAFALMWAVKEADGKRAGIGLPETDLHPALPDRLLPQTGGDEGSGAIWRVAGGPPVVCRIARADGERYALAVAP